MSTTVRPRVASRPCTITSAPWRPNSSAIALPMPLVAPVISAENPARCFSLPTLLPSGDGPGMTGAVGPRPVAEGGHWAHDRASACSSTPRLVRHLLASRGMPGTRVPGGSGPQCVARSTGSRASTIWRVPGWPAVRGSTPALSGAGKQVRTLNPYSAVFDAQKEYFASNVTRSYEWRIEQLDRMSRMIGENTPDPEGDRRGFQDGPAKYDFETATAIAEAEFQKSQLQSWMEPVEEPVPRSLAETGHKAMSTVSRTASRWSSAHSTGRLRCSSARRSRPGRGEHVHPEAE